MKYLNKLATFICGAALGMTALTSCEGSDMFSVNSPDWLQEKIDSIAATKGGGEEEIEGLKEDVYTIGATDYSTGWWAQFSKYYQIKEGEKWYAQFNLNINPAASNTYKNFALILCSDDDRGGAGYHEYGAIRFDNQPSGNSEWGDYINRDNVESTLTFETDTDAGVDKLGGLVTLSIDRTDPNNFIVKMTNGTVTKTYTHKHALENLNDDQSNTTMRAFLVPEGSYIGFLKTTIVPIGGCTSAQDKQPLSMTLNNVPRKILLGTPFEEITKNITATVNFETGVSKDAANAELLFVQMSDYNSVGNKEVMVIYNKTYKGENCSTPIVARFTFDVVDKMYTTIGAIDNSTGFWGDHSMNIKVNPGETYVSQFTNYCGGANWNNFLVVLCREDNSEYAVARADNWSWGPGWDGNAGWASTSGGQENWGAWLAAMNGAKVTTYVANNGDGTADLKAIMLGTDGNTYVQEYNGLAIEPENFYFRFTVDGCHLEFDNVVGAEDNTTGFWGAHSEEIQVPAGKTYTTTFLNYTNGAGNWNNFLVVLCAQGGQPEYVVARADNWSWGPGWDGNAGWASVSGGQENWAEWLAAMDEARVTVSVTNWGNGTVDLKAVMDGNNAKTYVQQYLGLSGVDADNLYFHFTVDGSHLVFDSSSAAMGNLPLAGKPAAKSRRK